VAWSSVYERAFVAPLGALEQTIMPIKAERELEMLKGKYTEIVLQDVELGNRTVEDILKMKARHEQFVNNGVNFSDNEYYDYPSLCEALDLLQHPKQPE